MKAPCVYSLTIGSKTLPLLFEAVAGLPFFTIAVVACSARRSTAYPKSAIGSFDLDGPLPCDRVTNRNEPRVAWIATVLADLFGSYTNLSSRTLDFGPTVRLLLS